MTILERDLYPEIRAALIAWVRPEAAEPWEWPQLVDARSLGDALLVETRDGPTFVLTVERADRPPALDRQELLGVRKILDAYGAPDVTAHPEGGAIELNLVGRLAFLLNPRNTKGFQRPLELLEEIDRLRARVAQLEGGEGTRDVPPAPSPGP